MEAYARVERIEQGRAWLTLKGRAGGCGRCDEPGGCRSVQLSHAFGTPREQFVLPATPGIEVGDRVRITIPDGVPLRVALLSYGLGVVLLLLGAALGTMLGDAALADLRALLGALAGLALAFAVNRVLARSRRWRASLHMELVATGEGAPDHACSREAP